MPQKHDFIKCCDRVTLSSSWPTEGKGAVVKLSVTQTSRNDLKQLSTLFSDSCLAAMKFQTRG